MEILDYLPVATTLVGGGIGSALEAKAQQTVSESRLAISEVWGDVVDTSEMTRRQKAGALLLGPLTLVGALGGVANGIAWQPSAPLEDLPPKLKVVVDHSAAVEFDDETVPRINSITRLFEDNGDIEAKALVVAGGKVREVRIENVDKKRATGGAPMAIGVEDARDSIKAELNEVAPSDKKPKAAVLAITNGNSIGVAPEESDTPVHVVNVYSGDSDPAVVEQLKNYAAKTGGKYWDSKLKDVTKIEAEVTENLTSDQTKDRRSNPMRIPLGLFTSAITAAATAITFKKRRNMTLS